MFLKEGGMSYIISSFLLALNTGVVAVMKIEWLALQHPCWTIRWTWKESHIQLNNEIEGA